MGCIYSEANEIKMDRIDPKSNLGQYLKLIICMLTYDEIEKKRGILVLHSVNVFLLIFPTCTEVVMCFYRTKIIYFLVKKSYSLS